jgi:queuosine precursor transporter
MESVKSISSHSSRRQYKYLGWLTAFYITFQLVSDVTAGKIVAIGMFTVSATVVYFPFTYIIADLLTEVYGYAKARSVVWMVLFCSMVAGVIYTLVVALPPAAGFKGNEAYTEVLGQVPRTLIGSWIAVWVGGIVNDYIMARMKVLTKGKYLWTRTISSTIAGEGVNTALFYFIALHAVIPSDLFLSSILSGWFLKVMVEVVMTPVTYRIVAALKKAEGEDYYDTDTDFNPLIMR